MKTLRESLLGDLEDNLKAGVEMAKNYTLFGSRFKFLRCVCNARCATVLDAINLKRVTKNMNYMHEEMENHNFMNNPKLKLLANFIDHIDLNEFDINIHDNPNTEQFRKNIGSKLKEYIIDNKLISKEDKFHIFAPSINVTGTDEFELIVVRTDSVGVMTKFRYKIMY